MVAQTRHAGPGRLEFREKLTGKTDALLKKLQTLHAQLAALDQDAVDTQSLNTVRRDLVHTSLLLHKDRGVKAHVACCLADILRLYAPDAPYTQPELRDIFHFFFRQLANGLKGGEAETAYFEQYFHLLESLSTVKSVVLVCDLPGADELMGEVFRDFFGLVRRGDLSKKVELFMADILVALVDEAQSVPGEVMDIILAQFQDKSAAQGSGSNLNQPAYRLAATVCNQTADKLQRNVCQYFSDIILNSSSSSSSNANNNDDSEDEDDSNNNTNNNAKNQAEKRYADIRVAHELIKALHRACPGVLHSVIPLLDEELRAEDVEVRLLATATLGSMFAAASSSSSSSSSSTSTSSAAAHATTTTTTPSQPSTSTSTTAPASGGSSLIQSYPSTYLLWLSRKNDKSPLIRLRVLASCAPLLRSPDRGVRAGIEGVVREKLMDPDERVRAAACGVVGGLDYEGLLGLGRGANGEEGMGEGGGLMREVCGRALDKKGVVRDAALRSLGRAYGLGWFEMYVVFFSSFRPCVSAFCFAFLYLSLRALGFLACFFCFHLFPEKRQTC